MSKIGPHNELYSPSHLSARVWTVLNAGSGMVATRQLTLITLHRSIRAQTKHHSALGILYMVDVHMGANRPFPLVLHSKHDMWVTS